MSHACREFEPLILDRAAGEIAAADLARLERHLAGCAACRSEAETTGIALSLAALPPPSTAEREAVARAAREALAVHRRRRRALAGALLALAASVAIAIGVPRLARSPGGASGAAPAVPAAAERAWEVPDLDAAWAAAGAADTGSADDAPEREPEVLFAELQEVDLEAE